VRKLVETPTGLLCEVALEDRGVSLEMLPGADADSFENFTRRWLSLYRITPEFKVVVADVSILLGNVRSWMDQVEISLHAASGKAAAEREREFLQRVAGRVIASFNAQHERFEELAYRVSPELQGAHQNHAWRAWHSFFLSTPFGHRTFYKPLGYAGDFEMMDMIHRNAPEGGSLFTKAMHLLLVSQWPAESVRNRIAHLHGTLVDEVAAGRASSISAADPRARCRSSCGRAR
jgi:extracellular factor (EF) 3-hydroxypalmitic acid methyl ester biosynthesis protein